MARYGFLGLGIMGSAMAANLVKAGFEVTVWNRTPAATAPLLALGAHQGTSPKEVAAAGDPELYRQAAPAFDRMGKKRLFLGATGQGARMKLVVNLIMGGMMTALCEGLALGLRGGSRADRSSRCSIPGRLPTRCSEGKEN